MSATMSLPHCVLVHLIRSQVGIKSQGAPSLRSAIPSEALADGVREVDWLAYECGRSGGHGQRVDHHPKESMTA